MNQMLEQLLGLAPGSIGRLLTEAAAPTQDRLPALLEDASFAARAGEPATPPAAGGLLNTIFSPQPEGATSAPGGLLASLPQQAPAPQARPDPMATGATAPAAQAAHGAARPAGLLNGGWSAAAFNDQGSFGNPAVQAILDQSRKGGSYGRTDASRTAQGAHGMGGGLSHRSRAEHGSRSRGSGFLTGISDFLGGGGGGGESRARNQTADWLVNVKGYEPSAARFIVQDKETLREVLRDHVKGTKPDLQVQSIFDNAGREHKVLMNMGTGEYRPIGGSKTERQLHNAGDGRFYDEDQGKWITAPADPNAGPFEGNSVEAQSLNHLVKTKQLTHDQAAQLGAGKTITNPADGSITFLTPQGVFGQPADGGPPQPLTPDVGGAPVGASRPGIIPLTEGKPGKLATEGERRNRSLYSVVVPELKVVEDNFAALTDIKNQAYARLPLSEFITTPEYQQAANSLQTIVTSYLYSVSGATATPEEVRKQTEILTPKPGESKQSVDAKLRRVRTLVDAIRQSGGQWEPPGSGGGAGDDAGRQRIRNPGAPGKTGRVRATNPQTGETLEFNGSTWEPVQ